MECLSRAGGSIKEAEDLSLSFSFKCVCVPRILSVVRKRLLQSLASRSGLRRTALRYPCFALLTRQIASNCVGCCQTPAEPAAPGVTVDRQQGPQLSLRCCCWTWGCDDGLPAVVCFIQGGIFFLLFVCLFCGVQETLK